MRWLFNTVMTLGMMGGLAMAAGGCDYDDHHHHDHDRWHEERQAGYRYDPYYRHDGRWDHDRDWERRYDRDWHHDRW